MTLNTYINFNGTCEEALRYYEKHLGAKTQGLMKWSQMPDADKNTPPGMADKVLHVRFALSVVLHTRQRDLGAVGEIE